jgi:hypothetical protein
MTNRRTCERYAAQHNLTIDFASGTTRSGRYYRYSVDLPDGLITESGYTGLGGETDPGDHTAAEVWGFILGDMESLVDERWVTLAEHEARQRSA